MNDLAVLVLAAGKSTRMKAIKQLVKIDDTFLLDITLEKAKKIAPTNTFCVLGANAALIKQQITTKNVTFVNNKNFETGLSSSIVSGIHYFKEDNRDFKGVMVLLADQPAIETTYLETMLTIFMKTKNQIIASNYGDFFGTPAIFPKKSFQDLLLLKGDKGAKSYLNNPLTKVIAPHKTTNFTDIDTLEQLKLFRNS